MTRVLGESERSTASCRNEVEMKTAAWAALKTYLHIITKKIVSCWNAPLGSSNLDYFFLVFFWKGAPLSPVKTQQLDTINCSVITYHTKENHRSCHSGVSFPFIHSELGSVPCFTMWVIVFPQVSYFSSVRLLNNQWL